jgi:hypothetical protein
MCQSFKLVGSKTACHLLMHIIDIISNTFSTYSVYYKVTFYFYFVFPVSLKEFWITDHCWLSSLESTKWLSSVSQCLDNANRLAMMVVEENRNVILQGKYVIGWIWIDLIDIIRKPQECLIRVTGSHKLIFSGLESPRPAVSGFQAVW